MDSGELFLLWVVACSVLVFFLVQILEEEEKRLVSESKTHSGPFLVESVKATGGEKETKSVGASENSEISEGEAGFFQENSISEKSDLISGNTGISEDDDWEGVERTELEKIFGKAVVFMNCDCSNADKKIDEDLKLQLYGLQKIALEGPCHGSQPMALKVSARAKWNAWQKLGDISREMAMEKYVRILSETIPDWKGEGGQAIQDAGINEDLNSTLQNKNEVQTQISGDGTECC